MAPSPKRRRFHPPSDLLSFFNPPPPSYSSSHALPRTSNLPETIISLAQSLVCVSTSDSTATLSTLLSELKSRLFSPFQLCGALFLDDDALPPLCVLVALLRRHILHPSDLPISRLRACAEKSLTSQACVCTKQAKALRDLILMLIDHGHVGERVLRSLVADVFTLNPHKHGLQLTRAILHCIQDTPDAPYLVESWCRQALIPSQPSLDVSRLRQSTACTPEISGLATGRPPVEYLFSGEEEARTVRTLCLCIPPSTAILIYRDFITLLTTHDPLTAGPFLSFSGALSRIVILIQRVLDPNLADSDAGILRSMQCFAAAAISSVNVQRDKAVTTILLVLMRRLFLPGKFEEAYDDPGGAYVEHERWLKGLVRESPVQLAEGLVNALEDLIPLENLRMLRSNHAVFSANKAHLRKFGSYLLQVRTRISELDPLHQNRFPEGPLNSQMATLESRRKASADVNHFVLDFAQTGGKLPKMLVRQMNFHRYHFRKHTLPVLLDPSLEPKGENESTPLLSKFSFDEHRINLIKVMAFKRKDNSISKEEAKKAIEAIQSFCARTSHSTENKNKSTSQSSSQSSLLKQSIGSTDIASAIEIYLRGCFKEQKRTKTLKAGEQAFINAQEAFPKLTQQISKSLSERQGKNERSTLAAEVLQGLLHALTLEIPSNHIVYPPEKLCELYDSIWLKCSSVVTCFLAEVIGHKDVVTLQRPLQGHIFALTCIRAQPLTPDITVCLAQVVCAMATLTGNKSMSDLSYLPEKNEDDTPVPFIKTLFDCLPMRDSTTIQESLVFALSSFRLLKVAWGEGKLLKCSLERQMQVHKGVDGSELSNNKSFTILPLLMRPLFIMLHWVLTSPRRLLSENAEKKSATAGKRGYLMASTLINLITHVLSSDSTSTSEKYKLRDWLTVEYRCGWGESNVVKRVFQKFYRSGISGSEILAASCLFLARKKLDMEAWPDWILQGVLKFTDELERVSDGRIRSASAGCTSMVEYLTTASWEFGAETACLMLDILSLTYYYCFQDTTLEQVDSFLEKTLLPSRWPLRKLPLRYIMRSLDDGLPTSDPKFRLRSEVFLITNLILHGNGFLSELRRWKFRNVIIKSLLSRTQEALKWLNLFNEAGLADQDTQSNGSLHAALEEGAKKFPLTAGLSLTFFVAGELQKLNLREDDFNQKLGNILAVLGTHVRPTLAIDLIDASVCGAALMPLTDYFAGDNGEDSVLRCIDLFMKRLIEERTEIFNSGPPCWARERLSNEVLTKDEFLWVLVKLPYQTMGNRGDQKQRSQCLNLTTALSLGRIFASVNKLSSNALQSLLLRSETEPVTNVLTYNILKVYKTLNNEVDKDALKISEVQLERLMTQREMLARAQIKSLVRIIREAQKLPDSGDMEKAIRESLKDMGNSPTEVEMCLLGKSSVLSSRA